MICRLEFVAKLRELTEHTRVIAVRHDAPNEEWIALARAAHELDPFTRVATFGETDQDRCALIGEALGITTHSQQTVELVHDKHAMRVRLRETGVDTTASAVVADLAALSAFVGEHPRGPDRRRGESGNFFERPNFFDVAAGVSAESRCCTGCLVHVRSCKTAPIGVAAGVSLGRRPVSARTRRFCSR